MAEVTAALVKGLRDKTGAGMMDCKKALTETGGNIEAAVDWLRTKGLATAAKKAGRVAAEGLVAIATEDGRGAVVEVNVETDFVARNETFQAFVGTVARLALAAGGERERLAATAYPETGRTVGEELTQQIATIGENMNLRRTTALAVEPGIVASYVHNAAAPGMGKIAVLVALRSEGEAGTLAAFGRQLAMHVAASNPQAVNRQDLSAETVERERAILAEQARKSGKPEEIIEKMVEGRLRKFYEEAVMLEQTFVIDGESKVQKAVDAAAAEAGAPIEIAAFVRYALGEGVERGEDDFAAEVKQLAG